MLLIPFPFLTAAVFITALLVLRGLVLDSGEKPSGFFIAFMILCALQSILIGTRHGYNIDALAPLLPVTALMIPPVAWASFSRPAISWALCWYLLPPLTAALAWWVFPPLIDVLVPAVFIICAVMIFRMALGPESGLSWVRLGQMINSRRSLFLISATLFVSALSDIAIALDFGMTDGQRLGQILMLIQVFCIFCVCLLLWSSVPTVGATDSEFNSSENSVQAMSVDTNNNLDQAPSDYASLETHVREHKLFLDPALSLIRLARKVGQPARRVSQAVNTVQGESISVWINNLRIEEAMRLLCDPQQTVTEVIYASGFNTKSSFNREFKRVTGDPPSVWRKKQQHHGDGPE